MRTLDILLSAAATFAAISCAMPCGANAAGAAREESLELNKSIARRVYEEGLNQGRFEVPYSENFVGHGGNSTFTHADGMAEAKGWRDAFPDINITVDKQVAEKDLVAVRWTARGTNTGTGNGLPATGRAVHITGTTLFRMADGRIAEEWTCANSLGLMKQLGMLQTTAAAPSWRQRASSWDCLYSPEFDAIIRGRIESITGPYVKRLVPGWSSKPAYYECRNSQPHRQGVDRSRACQRGRIRLRA
ncbi:ester cyclase [Pseudoxanthomonas sp. NC8]|nr:ester cyclase [Pseudoxanthomonas sp. NC8]